MKAFYRDSVWFKGSRKHIKRTIYKDNGKYFVKWYGEYIEVVDTHTTGFETVLDY